MEQNQNIQNQQQKQVFDDFPTVDCNDCKHYWDNSCDGTVKGSQRPCKAFSATRRVIYQQEIKSLKEAVRELRIGLIITSGSIISLALAHIIKLFI
jgi:hypothetical protein